MGKSKQANEFECHGHPINNKVEPGLILYSKVLLQVPELQSSTLQNYRTSRNCGIKRSEHYRRNLSISLQQGNGSMSDKNLVRDLFYTGGSAG